MAAARRHTKQPGPTAGSGGTRKTRVAAQRRHSPCAPRKQRRQVDAPAARQLRGLGAAGEAVRQVHRIGLR